MRKISIILDGSAGELDRRDIEILDIAGSDQASAAIRKALSDLIAVALFMPGDTIKIEEA